MIISVINQKGGVGKTTTAVNLAVSLALWGYKVTLVDLDPQANATSGVGITTVPSPTLYDCLFTSAQNHVAQDQAAPYHPAEDTDFNCPAVAPGPTAKLGVVGSAPALAGADIELAGNERRDNLRQLLKPLDSEDGFIIIDTPPSVSLLTVNALVASDRLIIPVQCEYYALEGLGQMLRTLELIRKNLNPTVHVMGLVRTMFDGRLGLSSQVSQELERHFAQMLFATVIPRNVRLAEAPSHGLPIAFYDRRSPGAQAYQKLAMEVIERSGVAQHAS